QHCVAEAPGLEVADPARVQPLEERRRIRAGDDELAERADVHDADALAHRPVLGQGVSVVLGAAPGPGRLHGRVPGEMTLVGGRAVMGPCAGPVAPGREAMKARTWRWHMAPWHGPMVAVV